MQGFWRRRHTCRKPCISILRPQDIVDDGDCVLDDTASCIRDGVYARIPTLWSATECDYCYCLPSMLSPTALPASYIQKLPHYFNQIQIAKILNETTLYPYNTVTPAKNGMSGAVLTLVQLLSGNAYYHAVFATGPASRLRIQPSGMSRR
ncbi:hypothetical protein L210DRAFT_195675 [Boletus edulis BED1]|uniref:Uncharacterized protein n=1 Tax=Boletus edulis BED1 TaxID=1328754 RepID=A0AAD4BY50_BOLED|nr:hypothetical protein L210DRAFT_195675 [Boletus edulis BED1]